MGIGFSFRPLLGDSTDAKSAPGRFLLLKHGDIGWADLDGVKLDSKAVKRIFANFKKMGNQVVVDYHHQTMKTDDGIKAPAAGWIRRLRFVEGEGLWAEKVEWTDEARAEIESKKFKYVSPVINVDKETHEIEELVTVALTNIPRTKQARELLLEAASLCSQRRNNMATATKPRKKKKATISAQEDLEVMEVDTDALPEPEAEEISEIDAAIAALGEALAGAGAEVPDDAVGIIAMAVEMIAGASEEPTEEAPPEEAVEADDTVVDHDQKVEAAAMKISKTLGLKGRTMRALTAEIAKVQVKASAVDGLSARLKVLEGDRKKSRVSALIEEQIVANKIHPDNKEQVTAARRLAGTVDEDQFREVYASMPGIEPGRLTDNQDSPKGSRMAMIAAGRKEWSNDIQGERSGVPVDCYVNVYLDDQDEKRMTPVEAEQLKKEATHG